MHSSGSILAKTLVEADSSRTVKPSEWPDPVPRELRITFHRWILQQLENTENARQTITELHGNVPRVCTYVELATMIRKASTQLRKHLPNKPGTRIIFLSSNSVSYLALYVGAIAIGLTPISIGMSVPHWTSAEYRNFILNHNIQNMIIDGELFNEQSTEELLNFLIRGIKRVFIFNYGGFPETKWFKTKSEQHGEVRHGVNFFLLGDLFPLDMCDDADLHNPFDLTNEACLGVSSSGTLHYPPRVALYNHHSLVFTSHVLASPSVLQFRNVDPLLMYGSFEQLPNLLMFIAGLGVGCPLVVLPSFSQTDMLEAFTKHNICQVMLSTRVLLSLMHDPRKETSLGMLRKVIVFGTKLPMMKATAFLERYTGVKSLRHCYLVCETPCPISLMSHNSHDYDSVGLLLPRTWLRVLENFVPLERDDTGLICIGREQAMFAVGFLLTNRRNQQELNFVSRDGQAMFRHWLLTDDLGYYNDRGLVYIRGKAHPDMDHTDTRVENSAFLEAMLHAFPEVLEVCVVPWPSNLYHDGDQDKWAAVIVFRETHPGLLDDVHGYMTIMLGHDATGTVRVFSVSRLLHTSTGQHVKGCAAKEADLLWKSSQKY